MSENNAIVTQFGSIWLASQPDEADLAAWKSNGAAIVINSRAPEETASLPFDMKATVEAQGMRYVELPIGGSVGIDPAHATALGEILDSAEGAVVMHCRSGTRSAHLLAAHMTRSGQSSGDPFDEMGWPGGRDAGMVSALTPR